MDFQRVSDKDVLIRNVPLHFINESEAAGIKAGGIISHTMTQIEIRCQAKHLPEYIEVDMANVDLNDVIHLADLALPKNTQLTIDVSDHSHNLPVVSIHLPKVVVEPEEIAPEEETEVLATEQSDAESEETPTSEEASPEEGA